MYSWKDDKKANPTTSNDAITEAQEGARAVREAPEAKKTEHDQSDVFDPTRTPPSSTALDSQPEKGKILGFDFRRDPLNAKKPMMTFEEIMKEDLAAKPKVMALQKKLLESRYNLEPRRHGSARMSRGKPI